MTVLAYRKAKHRIQRFWQKTEGRLKRKIAAALAVLVHTFFYASLSEDLGHRLDYMALDALFRVRGQIASPPEIVIVAMDTKSENDLGISSLAPWPRSVHAELIRRLGAHGAKRILLDLFFRATGPSDSEDLELAEALGTAETIIGSFTARSMETDEKGRSRMIEQEIRPLRLFEERAWKTILLDVFPIDEVVRTLGPLPQYESGLQLRRVPIQQRFILDRLLPEDAEMPKGDDFINFYGPSGAIPTVSFSDALGRGNGKLPPHFFKNKLVFVGKYLPTSYLRSEDKDTFLVSGLKRPMNGVEIHATIVGNLLQGSWIRRVSNKDVEILVLSILTFTLSYAIISLRLALGCFLLLATWALWSTASYVCLSYFYFFLPGVTMVFVVLPIVFAGSLGLTAHSVYSSFRSMERAMGIRKEQ